MAELRLLDPKVLSRLQNIELVAKTVVDGFLSGLHHSPFFGFSLEFAEYRPYAHGDDPRFIDWNVFSRTDRTYVRRYLGETNTHLAILFDASGSMGYPSKGMAKIEYARYLAASLAYLSIHQHDAVGLIVFDEKVRDYRPPSTRPGHLQSILHALDRARPSTGTNLRAPFEHFQESVSHRGLVAVISDFYGDPDLLIRAARPLAYQGQDMIFFQLLDPTEIEPEFGHSALLEDMETGDRMEVSGDYARHEYRSRMSDHLEKIKETAAEVGVDYWLIDISKPLDRALREYLLFRKRRG